VEAVDLQRQVGDNPRGLAMAVTHAGLAARGRGRYAAARALHEEAVVHARAAGNRGYEATNLAAMAHAAYLQGEQEVARAMAQESLAVFNTMTIGMRLDGTSIARYVLGRVALATGDYPLARQHLEESLALWRATGDARVAPGALVGLGAAALAEGDLALARRFLDEALTVSEETGSKVGLVYTLEGCAILAAADNQPESALRLEGAAAGLRAALEHPRSVPERALLERWLSPARRRLGDAAAAATSTAGAALSAEQALAYARALASAGRPQD
jgi:tetratricopeptide (TPR) repeat protein